MIRSSLFSLSHIAVRTVAIRLSATLLRLFRRREYHLRSVDLVTDVYRAPQHNPYAISTPHYAIHPYIHSTPAMTSHPYYPQHHGTTAPYYQCTGVQPWATQQQYEWQGHNISEPQQSHPYNAYRRDRQNNKGNGTTGPHSGHRRDSYSPEPTREPAQVRDNYRPAYTDSSPRQENVYATVYAYPRRLFVAGTPGPPKKFRGPSRAMSPLSSYLPQLERDPTQIPETSITSVSHTLAPDTTSFDTSGASGAPPSAALEPAQAIYT
jgi:hypothetical protein